MFIINMRIEANVYFLLFLKDKYNLLGMVLYI